MEKINFTKIKNQIKEISELKPKTIKLVNRKNAGYLPQRLDVVYEDYKNANQLPSKLRYIAQNRYIIIYAMIYDSMYDPDICKECRITISMVQKVYNELIYIKEFIDKTEEQWKETVFQRAREYNELEIKAYNDFANKPFSEIYMDNNPPRYYCKNIINKTNAELRDIRSDMAYVKTCFEQGSINLKQYHEQIIPLIERKNDAKSIKFHYALRHLNSNKLSQERMLYIESVKQKRVALNSNDMINTIIAGTITKGYHLIRDYCKWYNKAYENEILSARKEKRRLKDKERYNIKKGNQQKEQSEKRRHEILTVLSYFEQGKSSREIEKLVPFGRTKIQGIIKEIKSSYQKEAA